MKINFLYFILFSFISLFTTLEANTILDKETGKPLANVQVFLEYVLKPQKSFLAKLFPGMDHSTYHPSCVWTAVVATNEKGQYKKPKMPKDIKEFRKKLSRDSYKTMRPEIYERFYLTGYSSSICDKKQWKTTCLKKHNQKPEDRLEELRWLGHVSCYSKDAMQFNKYIYVEAIKLEVDFMDKRQTYHNSPTLGDTRRSSVDSIKNSAYFPEHTRFRGQSAWELGGFKAAYDDRVAKQKFERNKSKVTPLIAFIETEEFEKARYLINNNKGLKEIDSYYKRTPLHWLLFQENSKKSIDLALLLIDKDSDCNAKDSFQVTPLMLAVDTTLELVEKLVDCGADVNAANEEGDKVLHYADLTDRTDIIKYLISQGANK